MLLRNRRVIDSPALCSVLSSACCVHMQAGSGAAGTEFYKWDRECSTKPTPAPLKENNFFFVMVPGSDSVSYARFEKRLNLRTRTKVCRAVRLRYQSSLQLS